MIETLVVNLSILVVFVGVSIHAVWRARTDAAADKARFVADLTRTTDRIAEDVRARLAATAVPPAQPNRHPVRLTLSVRPGFDDPDTVAAVRRAVEAGLRSNLAPDVAANVEFADAAAL